MTIPLFDLLQYQTVAAISRFAYGVMMLLAVAFGLSIVVWIAGVDVARQPPIELAYASKLLFRAVASLVSGCAFAMVFNSPPRLALAAGLVALGANDLRLILADAGMMLGRRAICQPAIAAALCFPPQLQRDHRRVLGIAQGERSLDVAHRRGRREFGDEGLKRRKGRRHRDS